MSKTVDETEAQRHRAKMEKRKAVQDAEVAGKTIEKGLLIVHTAVSYTHLTLPTNREV